MSSSNNVLNAVNAVQAYCICSLMGAKHLVAFAKPMATEFNLRSVFTHRIWLKASPPVEAYS